MARHGSKGPWGKERGQCHYKCCARASTASSALHARRRGEGNDAQSGKCSATEATTSKKTEWRGIQATHRSKLKSCFDGWNRKGNTGLLVRCLTQAVGRMAWQGVCPNRAAQSLRTNTPPMSGNQRSVPGRTCPPVWLPAFDSSDIHGLPQCIGRCSPVDQQRRDVGSRPSPLWLPLKDHWLLPPRVPGSPAQSGSVRNVAVACKILGTLSTPSASHVSRSCLEQTGGQALPYKPLRQELRCSQHSSTASSEPWLSADSTKHYHGGFQDGIHRTWEELR